MTRPVRVLVDLSEMRPGGETGGAKHFVFEFLRRLAKWPETTFEFAYLTNSAVHAEVMDRLVRMNDEAVCVRPMPDAPMPATSRFAPRDRVWWPAPPDLAQQLGAVVMYCPFGSVALASPGIPIVSLIVDVLHRDYPQTLPMEGVTHREQLFAQTVHRSHYFQCISRYVMERLSHHYGVPDEQMFHTCIAIHDRLDHASSAAPPAGCPDRPFFFYPANAWVHKNQEGLLIAYRTYRARRGSQAWPLVLTGHDDARMACVRRWAEGLGLRANVHFFGHVAESELGALWRRAGALIFPSLHEGFGIPLVEAMHFGVPIAASNRCSLPEVAGDAALFFDPLRPDRIAEAMMQLDGNPDSRNSLVAAGHARLDVLCTEDEVAKLARYLQAAVGHWPVVACAGADPDGWIADRLVLGLPATACTGGSIRVEYIDHSPHARFTVSAGHQSLGSFAPLNCTGKAFCFEVAADTRAVTIRVVGGENMNLQDPRIHGARIRQVIFRPGDGEASHLLFPPPT